MKKMLAGVRVTGMSRWMVSLVLVLGLVVGLMGGVAWGQVGAAAISGVVQDQTGAIIPGTTVTVQNKASGAQRTTTSNNAGSFTFAALPVGDYSLTVQRQGFKELVQSTIHLNAGNSISLPNLKLQVGEVNQAVTVNTETAGLPLDSGQLSSTITSEDLSRLSVVGRDATELQRILPGFAIRNLGATNQAPDFSQVEVGQATPYASNGAPVAGITIKLDGANLTDAGSFGANLQNINDSFVSEVQVQTSNFGADQSNGPVIISGITKSGTARYHGSLYTYARTYQLNANDWLDKYDGIARPDDRYVYPGGTISGPVPHTKKFTYFAGAEYDAQRNVYAYGTSGSAIVNALVPTAAMRTGDFSQSTLNAYLGPNASNGSYGTFYTAPTVGDNGSALSNGNIGAFLNPGAMALVDNTLPLPNLACGCTNAQGFNYTTLDLTNNNVSQFVGRVDYDISRNNHFFARYSFEKGKQGEPLVPYFSPVASSVLGAVNTPGYGVNNDTWVNSGAMNYVTLFTPTATNEMYLTVASFVENFEARDRAALQGSGIGYPYNGAFNNGDTQYPQLGTYTTYGGLPLGLWPDVSLNPLELKKLQPNVGDNFTKVWGNHTVKIGIFSQRTTNNQTSTDPDTNGVIQDYYYGGAGTEFFDYNGTYADGSPAYGNPHFNSGNALANFFEGQIQDWHQQNFNPYTDLYFWDTDFYAQDAWRVQPNFLLTFGVRFMKEGAWQDAHGVGAAIWDPALYSSTYSPTTNPLPGFTWHALDSSVPNSGSPTPPMFFEPRFGFAWDVFKNGKMVVRGGAGVYRFHDSVTDVTSAFAEAEDVRYTDLEGFGDNTLEGVNTLHLNPTTYGNTGTSSTETYIAPTTVYGLDPTDNQEPVTNNYSLSVAREMPGNWVLQASYVGNNSNSLLDNGTTQTVVLDNINAIPIGTLYLPSTATAENTQAAAAGQPLPCNPTGCTPAQVGALAVPQGYAGQGAVQVVRPYNRYNQILEPEHNTYANYNGLQIEGIKQAGKFTFNANYSFSKALGILGSSADFNWTAGIDPFHLDNNYGPMNFDRTQVLNLSYAYQTGRFTEQRMLGGLINYWLISGITNVQSGPNMQTGVSASPGYYLQGNIGSGASGYAVSAQTILGTPDVNLQPVLTCNPRSGLAAHQYLNPNCFAVPALGTNGQYIEPYAHGPAFFNSDLTLEKGFGLGGERHLRFRYAAFNFLNHPLNSFGTGYASQTTLLLSGATPGTATYSPTEGFGSAPLKLGRRLSEVSLVYSF